MSLPELMVGRSTLTKTQLESLSSYLRVVAGEIGLKDAAAQRSGGGVTIGSYYRTVSQARTKVRASMVTILIGSWLGVIRLDDARRLFDLAGRGAANLSEEEQERFIVVLQALLDKLVM